MVSSTRLSAQVSQLFNPLTWKPMEQKEGSLLWVSTTILRTLVTALVIPQGEGAGSDLMGIAVYVGSYRTGGACSAVTWQSM